MSKIHIFVMILVSQCTMSIRQWLTMAGPLPSFTASTLTRLFNNNHNHNSSLHCRGMWSLNLDLSDLHSSEQYQYLKFRNSYRRLSYTALSIVNHKLMWQSGQNSQGTVHKVRTLGAGRCVHIFVQKALQGEGRGQGKRTYFPCFQTTYSFRHLQHV